MWKTTKLIEGGHRGLQDYRHICYYFYFFVFLRFFKIQNVVTFYFFAVFRTLSRTMQTDLFAVSALILKIGLGLGLVFVAWASAWIWRFWPRPNLDLVVLILASASVIWPYLISLELKCACFWAASLRIGLNRKKIKRISDDSRFIVYFSWNKNVSHLSHSWRTILEARIIRCCYVGSVYEIMTASLNIVK